MAIDERERNFEKALARELRAGGASALDCPDAETLAAYHERMLSPEEMAAQKSHIAACASCQEILATLEVTEAIPVAAEDSAKVVAERTVAAPASGKSAAVREMPKKKTHLRWVTPAGAIAAGLLVWVAVNSNRHATQMTKQAPVQVAENRESGDARLVAPKQQPAEMERQKASSATTTDEEASKLKAEFDALKPAGSAGAVAKEKTNAARTYEHGPRATQNQMQNQVQSQIQNNGRFSGQNKALEEKRLDDLPVTGRDEATLAQNAPGQVAQSRTVTGLPQPAAPPPPPVVGGAAGASAGTKTESNKDAAIGAATQTVEVQSEAAAIPSTAKRDNYKSAELKKSDEIAIFGALTATNLRDAKAGTPGFVGTPDPQVFWFFTTNGMVFHSEDGGKTTKLQKTGEGMKFIAGSAPDKKTCWLLAEDGKVLRTTNAGKNWAIVAAPPNQNFSMITAVDAKTALITDTAARVSYATSDGGTTWKVVPQP